MRTIRSTFCSSPALILLLLAIGKAIKRRLRDNVRRVWRRTLQGEEQGSTQSPLERFRNSTGYQRFVQRFKWYVLPDGIVAPLTVAAAIWIVFAAYTQATLPFLEKNVVCRASGSAPGSAVPEIGRVARDFATADTCSESFGLVRSGHRYVVTFDVGDDPWYDASLAASPEGISSAEFPWGLGYLAAPFKRVINAHYLQPLFEIRPPDGGNIQIYPLSVRQVGDARTQFRADFTAARDGELFLFVNDAMLPMTGSMWGDYDYRYFYRHSGRGAQRGNRGTACVTIESVEAVGAQIPSPPAGSICERVIARRTASG
jgi:hypothetical protein